jgi:acyl-CoA hydrolase
MTSVEFFSNLKDGANVFLHSAACNPTPLVEMMCEAALEQGITNLKFYHLHLDGEAKHLDEKYQSFAQANCFFVGANCRKAMESGQASYIPVFLSQVHELFTNGAVELDYALIQVSPFDEHGYATMGPSVDVSAAALHCAKKVIAMINPKVPKVFGDGVVHVNDVDACIDITMDLPSHESSPPSEVNMQIGKHVANLIENGSTLQMGIGDIPNAVLSQLTEHEDLGIHTEMFSDGLIPLVQKGVITNKYKKVHPYRIVSSFAIGSRSLYNFLNDNPIVHFREASFVNDPRIILKNPKVCAINSAIEVDITGQICADSIGRKIYSGVGGQVDFMRGAALSEGGKAIIALPSRTKKGKSKIVIRLAHGAGVVTTRAHAQYIVTEYGSVNLMGMSLRERAKALISIAHPDDRESLLKEMLES